MKNHDASGCGVLNHVLKTSFRIQSLVKISTDYIPHHNGVTSFSEQSDLLGFYFSVGWTKEVTVNIFGGFCCVFEIGF